MSLLLRRSALITLVLAAAGLSVETTLCQEVTYDTGADGVRYQVTRRVTERQVPVTVMQDRQQTVYQQQITTSTLSHQQLYSVPVTSYQWNSQLRGRWNPFVTPYWTHHLRPVTSWQTQIANVQIPVSQVAWAPQTRTVQVPVTEYRTAKEETVTRIAMNEPRTLASAKPLNGPTAVLAARPSTTTTSSPIGGRAMQSDPPRQATGWQTQLDSQYR